MSEVFYDGSNIYRDLKPYSRTIHKLLNHLQDKNISFVPRFLGIDQKRNQEVLTFMDGRTIDDYPEVDDIEYKRNNIIAIADMMKKYHDATLDFKYSEEDKWFLEYKGDLQKEVICHNDISPYNVTFLDNKPAGIIDFDTVCPAPRIWDIAYAIYRFVPLSRLVYVPAEKRYRQYIKGIDVEERKLLIHSFLDTYKGFSAEEVLNTLILRLESLVELFDKECKDGNTAFINMKKEGHQDFYVEEIKFIKQNMNDWI